MVVQLFKRVKFKGTFKSNTLVWLEIILWREEFMMKKKVWLVLLAAVLVFGFAVFGCSSPGDDEPPAPPPTTDPDAPPKTERKVELPAAFMWSGGQAANQKGWFSKGYIDSDIKADDGTIPVEDFRDASYLVLKMTEKKDSGFTIIWGGDQGTNTWEGWKSNAVGAKSLTWDDANKELKIQLSNSLIDYKKYQACEKGIRLVIQNFNMTLTDFIKGAYLLILEEGATQPPPDMTDEQKQAAFDAAVGIKALTSGDTSETPTVKIDTTTGVISRALSESWGSWFSIAIPEDQLPVVASDTIVVKYIGLGDSIPLMLKKPNTTNDISSGVNQTLIGDGVVQTLEIPAKNYGTDMPSVVTFQASKNATKAWYLKIISIEVKAGNGIVVPLAIPATVRAPVNTGTPVTSFSTDAYTASVAWEKRSGAEGAYTWAAYTSTFAKDDVYRANITLSLRSGYTFAGIAANTFTVSGATNVTNIAGKAGSVSMVVTATFPAAPEAETVNITFANASELGVVGATVVLNGTTGYDVTQTAGYDNGFVYFKVKFAEGKTLGNYNSVKFTIITTAPNDSNNIKYKNVYVTAFAAEPAKGVNTGVNLIASKVGGNPLGNLGTYNFILETKVDSTLDKNEVYIGITPWADGACEFTVKDIAFLKN